MATTLMEVDQGIIPANTGRITLEPGRPRCRRDHPRESGENIYGEDFDAPDLGSSPRIRGECYESKL